MSAGAVSGRVRCFVVASAAFLLAWRAGTVVGVSRSTEVALGLLGFVLHVLFGKAYALLPAYFDSELAWTGAPLVHLPLTVAGAVALAAAPFPWTPPAVAALGAIAWAAGVGVFLATLAATLRGNLAGTETGTGEANAHRRRTDRLANAVLPIALAYLALGSYAVLAPAVDLPPLLDGYPPRATHLLAAGTATLFVLGVGFRLLPRFFVATPPRRLVAPVLGAGAVAPGVLAVTLPGGPAFRLAAILEAVAVVGFAVGVGALFRHADRRRVGFYGVLAGAGFGVVGVLLGLSFAFDGPAPGLVTAHLRANVLGFLGLTIVGVTYQFYPPTVGSFPGAGDRTALASIACLGGGLAVEVAGLAADAPAVVTAGGLLALVGACLWAFLLVGLFRER